MLDAAKQTTNGAAIVLGCTTACVVLCAVVAGQRRRLAELEKEVARQGALRSGEHAGRVKAEKVGRQCPDFLRTFFFGCDGFVFVDKNFACVFSQEFHQRVVRGTPSKSHTQQFGSQAGAGGYFPS